ncbi:hypothetical protein EJB05_25265, partial [Eragrostis curvula]
MGKLRSAASQAPIRSRSSRHAKSAHAAVARRGSGSDNTRDWADLGDGPASLIAERVLADDVASYILFRAVCRPWRRCCDDPRTRGGDVLDDPRLRPRQWIMLLGAGEDLAAQSAPHSSRRQFLNVCTGQCIQVDVPELLDHGVFRSTAGEGLLFLHCKATSAIRLLNPLTRQKATLPPGPTGFNPSHIGSCWDTCAGLADDHTTFLYSRGDMAFAKPGGDRWLRLESNSHLLMPNVFFAGRFYGIANREIMTVDMNRGDDLPPRLAVVARLDMPLHGMPDKTAHLVDNGGKLMLVHRTTRRGPGYQRSYRVYKVDLEARTVTTRGGVGLSLGGRAIFLARWHAISVSPKSLPSIDANTIYPGFSLNERGGSEQIGAYHIRDGRIESFGYDNRYALSQPWSIADCLAIYVSAYDA